MNLHEVYMAAQLAAENGLGNLPTGALKLKGQVETVENLPANDNSDGDVYIVGTDEDTDKAEYYWFDDQWNYLGETPVDLGEYVKNTDYATSTNGGIVKVDGGLGIDIGSNRKLYCSRPSAAEVIAETNNYRPLTPNTIPVFMNNYGLAKSTISDMQTDISNKQDKIQVVSAEDFSDLDTNEYPVGTIFMIWGDSE